MNIDRSGNAHSAVRQCIGAQGSTIHLKGLVSGCIQRGTPAQILFDELCAMIRDGELDFVLEPDGAHLSLIDGKPRHRWGLSGCEYLTPGELAEFSAVVFGATQRAPALMPPITANIFAPIDTRR